MENKMEDNATSEKLFPNHSTVKEFSADGFKRTVNAVKAFHALPQPGPSWDLNKSYPEFSRAMKNARSKLVPMMASLLKHVNMPTSDFKSRDIDEKFEFLVESNDDLLERIGSSLDEADGFFKKSEALIVDKGLAVTSLRAPGTWGKRKLDESNQELKESISNTRDVDTRQIKKPVFRSRVNEKPQLKFSIPIDNCIGPFVPVLKEKPHSLKPLSILPEYTSNNEEFFGHPYNVELNKWEPSDSMLTKVVLKTPRSLRETPIVYVSTPRDLERLMHDLLNKTEIAVDLEHHSYRTFLGLTCLIQISTREKDYVIDSLALREHLGNLNEIFTDPKVLKVFHGASNDIEWLQRDFGLYVVNMFDTYIAAKALSHPQLSLQYLLGRYFNVSQNKSLQLADWRIRPLPNDMLEYARQDTHYLLHVYELLQNELIEAGNQYNNFLVSVYDQSRAVCLKRYEKPSVNPQLALRKLRRSLNNRQLYAFTEIYKWRDQTARERDESLGYVLPNHMLLTIAESLPKEMNGILACCDPVPPLIQHNLAKLHKIITSARELPLQQETTQKDKVEKKQKLKNWVIIVNSIHDITSIEGESTEVVAGENDDELLVKPDSVGDTIAPSNWPQPWVDPGDWKKLVKKEKTQMMFNSKVSFVRKRPQTPPGSCVYGITPESMSTPYGRYQVSQKISEMLKDPKKQSEVDMEDPLVKAVYETVLIDDSEANNENNEEVTASELTKVLDDGDFIPFNPLAEPATKKRKKREPKHEPWAESKLSVLEDKNTMGIGNPINDDEFDEPRNADTAVPILTLTKKKNRRKKGNFLNRLKNTFSRNKSERKSDRTDSTTEQNCDLEGNADMQERDPNKKSKAANKFQIPRDGVIHNSPAAKRERRTEQKNSTSRPNQRSSPGQGKGFGREQNRKNKAGIFKAWKRDNRSITFK